MTKVELYVYDHRKDHWWASLLSPFIGSVWHTSIVISWKDEPREYFYSDEGICSCSPGKSFLNRKPDDIIFLGNTEKTKTEFERKKDKMEETEFSGDKYNILSHNCNNFTNEISKFLVGKGIPKEYFLTLGN